MKDGKFDLKTFLNEFEQYLATIFFLVLTILLMVQVISRYVFSFSLTWLEELATVMFVWMVYFGISGAVRTRKHLKIDAILDIVPFKAKKVMLILDNIIFMFFNLFVSYTILDIIERLVGSKTSILKMPKDVIYAIIPVMLTFTCIRLVQDCIKLAKENEQQLGASKPTIDLDALEAEYRLEAANRESQAQLAQAQPAAEGKGGDA